MPQIIEPNPRERKRGDAETFDDSEPYFAITACGYLLPIQWKVISESVRVDEAMNAGTKLRQHGTRALRGESDRKLLSNTRQMASVSGPFATPDDQRRCNTSFYFVDDGECTTKAKHFRSWKADKLSGRARGNQVVQWPGAY